MCIARGMQLHHSHFSSFDIIDRLRLMTSMQRSDIDKCVRMPGWKWTGDMHILAH